MRENDRQLMLSRTMELSSELADTSISLKQVLKDVEQFSRANINKSALETKKKLDGLVL